MKKYIALFTLLFTIGFLPAQSSYSFNIERSGSGTEHLILIPGFTCDGEVWDATVEQLKDQFACHSLTMAGFAGQKAQATPSIDQWVSEIAAYIKNESLGKVTIIGHSLGGLIAQWLAADHPEYIQRIIVVDALPCLPALTNPNFEALEVADCSQSTMMFTSMDDAQFEQMQKMNLGMMTTDQSKHALLLKWSLSSDRNTLAEIFCQLMNTDLRDKIASVQCPSLILLESNFKMMQPMIEQQYSQLADVELAYANQGMHFIMYDDQAWYLDQLNSFLR